MPAVSAVPVPAPGLDATFAASSVPVPAADYDQLVEWAKRLEREAPLFRRVFAEAGVSRLIDVGAGSARHAIMFAEWGIAVDAVDPDESMLAQAEVNAAEAADRIAAAGGRLRLHRAAFGGLAALGLEPADALICTGNALPHVGGREGLRTALADFACVVRPGGAVILHLLNHERLLAEQVRVIPPVVRETSEGTKVFLRIMDYPDGGKSIDFDFVTLVRDHAGSWTVSDRRSLHTALPANILAEELEAVGFSGIELLGGHDGSALGVTDESVILVARRSS